jgi:putative heme-binding domain-containing protein
MTKKSLTLALLQAATRQGLTLPVDARTRQQLVGSADADIAAAARQVLALPDLAARDEVIKRYQPPGAPPADTAGGRRVFERVCATCHKIGELGHAVGPDLTALSNKSVDFLLTAILDPNRAVESNYLDYLVETSDGRQFSGILLAETANSVRLLAAEGKEQAVLRHDIEAIRATGKSLMPEGLEKDISPEQMHDLMAFLRTFAPARKLYAGNQPQLAPVRDDGSIRLLAMHAEIYGPTLVYEELYSNLGFWGSSQDYAVWNLDVPTAGTYEVTFDYACSPESAGNRFVLSCEDQQLSGEVRATGSWDEYDWHSSGTIELPAGRTRVILRPEAALNQYLLDLHQIVLEKKNK